MTGLKEMTDAEFESFILENKERIKTLLCNEDSEFRGFVKDELKSMKKKAKKAKKKVEGKAEEKIAGIRDAAFSEDVQKHLVGAGIELMLGITALIDAMPKPEKAQEMMDKVSEARKNASNAYCAKNPDCPKKKAELKKIELE